MQYYMFKRCPPKEKEQDPCTLMPMTTRRETPTRASSQQDTMNASHRFSRQNNPKMLRWVTVLLIIVISQVPTVQAGTDGRYSNSNNDSSGTSNNEKNNSSNPNDLPLASCPTGDHVVGTYYNNGRKCVRDRQVVHRESQPVVCPDGYKFHSGFCKKNGLSKRVKPQCPEGFDERKGKFCYQPCSPGFEPSKNNPSNEKRTCVMPRDILSIHYMECPSQGDYHRVGSKCCPSASSSPECLVQCQIDEAPGKFYYKTAKDVDGGAKCVRRRHVLPRIATSATRSQKTGKFTCKAGYQKVGGNFCQEACPEGYLASKGKCTLPQCTVIPSDDTSTVKCQEGTYGIPSTQM